MGHSLIREGVKGDFKFTTETKGIKGGLQSSSPGLLFVLLGLILIGYAIFIDKGVTYDSLSNDNKNDNNYKQQATKPEIGINTTRIQVK